MAAVVLMLPASGCASGVIPAPGGGPASPVPVPSSVAAQPTPTDHLSPDADFPQPSAAFRRQFTDPLYYDEGEEFSPFGSDEGFDILHEWVDRRGELTRFSTVEQIYGAPLAGAEDNGPDVDGALIGAGFALILLTGRIDPAGREATLAALHRTYSWYADQQPREPAVMVRDLEAFPATPCASP